MLNDLYTNSFTKSSVSGGFARAGVWPFDDTRMKEKVVRGPTNTAATTLQP